MNRLRPRFGLLELRNTVCPRQKRDQSQSPAAKNADGEKRKI